MLSSSAFLYTLRCNISTSPWTRFLPVVWDLPRIGLSVLTLIQHVLSCYLALSPAHAWAFAPTPRGFLFLLQHAHTHAELSLCFPFSALFKSFNCHSPYFTSIHSAPGGGPPTVEQKGKEKTNISRCYPSANDCDTLFRLDSAV